MLKITAVIIATSFFVAVVSALPVTGDNKLDKATQNDVSINLVSAPKVGSTEKPQVTISIGATSGLTLPDISAAASGNYEDNKPTGLPPLFPPQPPRLPPKNVFTRLIDDIFQIPIGVLQSVTKLLTNPFTQLDKEKSSS